MMRAAGWENRLAAALREGAGREFSWGEFDCCLFAGDCVLAMTGVDPADWFRGGYSTALGAVRKLREYSCGGGLPEAVEIIATGMGWREVAPAFAQRGDLALVELDDGPGMGVVDMTGQVAVAVRPSGLGRLPVVEALRAWRVC